MNEMQVIEPRRRGRPKFAGCPLVRISIGIPADKYEKLGAIASAQGMSIAHVARFAIQRAVSVIPDPNIRTK